MVRSVLTAAALLLACAWPCRAQDAAADGFPVACTLGSDCFVQQLPDVAPGAAVRDPFCGRAAYDGHDGLDVRLRSLKDMERGVAVLATAPGTGLRVRDAMADQLAAAETARPALAGRECGNGVVIRQDDGLTAQYCHLRRGSVRALPGARVAQGERIAEVGASGLAAFPHVHLSLSRDGRKLDPLTGRPLDAPCAKPPATLPLLTGQDDLARRGFVEVLALGIAGRLFDYDRLVVDGPPLPAGTRDSTTLGYVWLINVQAGDRIRTLLRAPGGAVFSDHTSEPLSRGQAAYLATSGRRRAPVAGRWTIEATVLRAETSVLVRSAQVEVR